MKCEHCGSLINNIDVNMFNYDGSDGFYSYPIQDTSNNAIVIDTDNNWTGYDLSEEERLDTIECPICHKFPFKSTEMQVYEIVRIVCFTKETKDERM